jgi:CxxC motif-containing protein (DUF1111 family)
MARLGCVLGCLGLCVVVGQAIGNGPARADSGQSKTDSLALGYEIFNREWMPNDPRGHGGDGLGPVYNDSSCVACHNSGGGGGAGPVSKNIDILSASRNGMIVAPTPAQGSTASDAAPTASLDPLLELHAGFRTSRTAVLHKFGIDPNYQSWRARALSSSGQAEPVGPGNPTRIVVESGSANLVVVESKIAPFSKGFAAPASNTAPSQSALTVGQFRVARSQRNPTALFGLGLIDAIPDAAIEAIAKREAMKSPQTQGRVSRLKDGQIGRLGWKAQTQNVEEFVLNACAVELGLEVPGHHQAISPQAPKYRTTGLDLTSAECAALVAYVRSIPKPIERRPSGLDEAKHLGAGKALFASVGCADCHTPKLGDVEGIYSDLLLHDMGQDTADDGSYSDDGSDGDDPLGPLLSPAVTANSPAKSQATKQIKGATRQEWRTPPLWGCRDSGPYLHDGRAHTLEQAITLHGGQGSNSVRKFLELSPRERLLVEAFLKSMVAPPTTHLAQR